MDLHFKPSQEMIFATVNSDRQRLDAYCLHHQGPYLSLDLQDVVACDSAGLALLIEAQRLARANNKLCQIQRVPKFIEALIEFSGVQTILS